MIRGGGELRTAHRQVRVTRSSFTESVSSSLARNQDASHIGWPEPRDLA